MTRCLVVASLVLLAAAPSYASSFTLLIGDKDGFGQGVQPGGQIPCVNPQTVPCLSPIQDWRSALERLAANGAQLTDVYSALYSGVESDCPISCSPNGETGTVIFPFSGLLTSASITMLIGDFQSTLNGAMPATINGVPIGFAFDDGFRNTSVRTLVLTPQMLAAANLAGEIRLFLDHRAFFDPNDPRNTFGSFDYIAFDYFELTADVVGSDVVPEPGTWLLLGTGLAALAARRRLRKR